jgi:hypothetical protein
MRTKRVHFTCNAHSLMAHQRVLRENPSDRKSHTWAPLKVHKIEKFFGSNFEFCVISLLVMLKY